jgi:hypothetical protein
MGYYPWPESPAAKGGPWIRFDHPFLDMTSFIIQSHADRPPSSWSKQMEDCTFCSILRKELPAWVVYENEFVIAILGTSQGTAVGILIDQYTSRYHAPADRSHPRNTEGALQESIRSSS